MARRIRWQIVIAVVSILLIAGLLGGTALRTASVAMPLAGGAYSEAAVGIPRQPIPIVNDPLADPTGRDLIALLFDGLVRIGADGLIEPALAAAYQVDASGTIYHFHLRQDVTWHDGRPFTADDVVFTLRTLQIADRPGEPAIAAAWQDVLVDRIDEHTVRITLTAPYAPFLSIARVPIVPAHVFSGLPLSEWASAPLAPRLIGTGPYRLVELREDRALLEANLRYFGGRPYIERFELRFVAAPEAAFAALVRGEVTAFGARVTGTGPLSDLPSHLREMLIPLDEYTILSFNLRRKPLDTLLLRRALAHGLNKDALIEQALDGLAVPLDTPILPGWWAYNPDVRWYDPDPATADRMLTELGYELGRDGVRLRDGRPLAFELLVDSEPKRRAVAAEIARQWGALGVQITVTELDGQALQERLRNHDFDMALHTWTRLGPDPDPFALWHSSQAANGLNYAGLQDQKLDDLLAGGRRESELAARSAEYAAFQKRWVELAPSITLYQPLYRFAAAASLGGAGLEDPDGSLHRMLIGREDRYRNVTRWFLQSFREIQGELR